MTTRAQLRRSFAAATLLGVVVAVGVGSGACKVERGPRFQHVKHAGAGLSCTSCHDGIFKDVETKPVEDVRREVQVAESKCVTCHKEPHPGKTYAGACATCHGDATRQHKAGDAPSHLIFSHAKHATSSRGQCFPCHSAVATTTTSHGRLLPTMATCLTCHQKEFDGMACGMCHQRLDVYPIKPISEFAHAGDFVRSHGRVAASRPEACAQCHTQPFCAGCHDPKSSPTRLDLRWPTEIERNFIHRGDYVGRHSIEARSSGDSCVRCHTVKECTGCHDKRGFSQGSGRSPHPAGWVSVTGGPNLHGRSARREIVACAGCHDQGAASNCVGCHRVGGVGGNPHPPGFRSRLNKGRDVVCRVCH